jgi:hypothetical protein
MKKWLWVCLCVLACARTASSQPAQISIEVPVCGGSVVATNDSAQFGYGRWLMYSVSTSIGWNVCVTGVKASAYVVGVAGSANEKTGTYGATARKQVPVPFDGSWIVPGTHSFVFVLEPWHDWAWGGTLSSADIQYRPEPDPDPEPEECEGEWDYEFNKCIWNYCPIIIDMDRSGYKLTGMADGVTFDLKGDGTQRRIGWTREGSDDAFLALDRNGNGRIDNGTELFGTATPVLDGRATAPNGFEALSMSLGGGMHLDNVLDARSPLWPRLLLWTDRNHNGLSEPDELLRLADSGIAAVDLNYRLSGRKDGSGNWFRQRAEITWLDGRSTKVYDVWLTIR